MQLRLQGVPIPLQLKPCSPVYPKYSVIPDPSLWYVSSGFIIKHNFMVTKYFVTADAPFNITAFGCAQYLKYNLRLWQCPLPLPMPTYFKLVAEFSVTTNTFYFCALDSATVGPKVQSPQQRPSLVPPPSTQWRLCICDGSYGEDLIILELGFSWFPDRIRYILCIKFYPTRFKTD